jgi:hypothetical protein
MSEIVPELPFPSVEVCRLTQDLIQAVDDQEGRAWICVAPPEDSDYYSFVRGCIPTEAPSEVEAEGRYIEAVFDKMLGTASEINWGFGDSRDDYGIWEGPTTYLSSSPEEVQQVDEMTARIASPTIRDRFRRLWAALNAADSACFIGLSIDGSGYYFSLKMSNNCFLVMSEAFGKRSKKVN